MWPLIGWDAGDMSAAGASAEMEAISGFDSRVQGEAGLDFTARAGRSRVVRYGGTLFFLILTVTAVLYTRRHPEDLLWVALPVAVLATAPLLLLCYRRSSVAVAVVLVANGVFVIAGRLPWPPSAGMAWVLALAVCPVIMSGRASLTAVLGTEFVVAAGACVPSWLNARPWDAPTTEALVVLLVWGASNSLRSNRAASRERAAASMRVHELQQRDALASSRAAIARELHDVVAHHVSLIAVRAATTPYLIDNLPVEAETALAEIAVEARMALDELRTVLGVLRTPNGRASQTPQPTLSELPELVDRMRASGMAVEFTELGSPHAVPEAAGLCCYRIVQEALTNAARHAPGNPVSVAVEFQESAAVVTIVNLRGPETSTCSSRQPGFGILGMRERVSALGGQLHAAPEPSGFRVWAHIPYGSDWSAV